MNKPEKVYCEKRDYVFDSIHRVYARNIGYNQGLDDREKWLQEFLPTIDELLQVMIKAQEEHEILCSKWKESNPKLIALFPYIAKKIAKRIGKEPK